jgi:chromosome partitioning protein
MAIVYSISNQKGGVGKTVTTANLGAALAELSKKVLLVDLDPQGSLSACFGIDINNLEKTIYNALLERKTTLNDVKIRSGFGNLDLIPANIDLSAAEILLINEIGREKILARALKPIKSEYDYILIDCPPSLGLLTVNSLTAADKVIIPVQCSFLATRGLRQLTETIDKIQERANPHLEIGGILLTRYDSRTLHANEVVEKVREAFGPLVFETIIKSTVRFDEAPVAGKPILEYASDSEGSLAYRQLAKELLNRSY